MAENKNTGTTNKGGKDSQASTQDQNTPADGQNVNTTQGNVQEPQNPNVVPVTELDPEDTTYVEHRYVDDDGKQQKWRGKSEDFAKESVKRGW